MKELDAKTRIQLNTILYATDFSDAARAAAPYAAELAKHYDAKLCAFHVRPPAVNPMTPPETWRHAEEIAEMGAEEARCKLLELFEGLHPQVLIAEGDLWSNLSKVIEDNRVDLIVVGTHGRSGVRKFLLGSTAEEIFRQAQCPVLTVGPHSPVGASQGGEIKHIVFAADFTPESNAAARYAISFAEEYQAHLTLLHVLTEPQVGDLVQPEELAGSSLQLLYNLVPADADSWCVPEYIIEYGEPAGKILDVAARRRADLIVLGVRQAGATFGITHLPIGIAHAVVSQATSPVLTVRA